MTAASHWRETFAVPLPLLVRLMMRGEGMLVEPRAPAVPLTGSRSGCARSNRYDWSCADQPRDRMVYFPEWAAVPSPELEETMATIGLSPSAADTISTGQQVTPGLAQLPLMVTLPSTAEPASGWQNSKPGVEAAVQR